MADAKNAGMFVIDMKNGDESAGENWLRDAAVKLPASAGSSSSKARWCFTTRGTSSATPAWGSNDPNRTKRVLGFSCRLAIMTEFVSTNGRNSGNPPAEWNIGSWKDPKTWFAAVLANDDGGLHS